MKEVLLNILVHKKLTISLVQHCQWGAERFILLGLYYKLPRCITKWKLAIFFKALHNFIRVLCKKSNLHALESYMLLFLENWLIAHSKGSLSSSAFPLPVSLCATCYLPWSPGTDLIFIVKNLTHIFCLFDGKPLSVYFLSTTLGFLYICLLVCAFFPLFLCAFMPASSFYHSLCFLSLSSPSFRMWVLSEVY